MLHPSNIAGSALGWPGTPDRIRLVDARGRVRTLRLNDWGPYPVWYTTRFHPGFKGSRVLGESFAGDKDPDLGRLGKWETNLLPDSVDDPFLVYSVRVVLPSDTGMDGYAALSRMRFSLFIVPGGRPVVDGCLLDTSCGGGMGGEFPPLFAAGPHLTTVGKCRIVIEAEAPLDMKSSIDLTVVLDGLRQRMPPSILRRIRVWFRRLPRRS